MAITNIKVDTVALGEILKQLPPEQLATLFNGIAAEVIAKIPQLEKDDITRIRVTETLKSLNGSIIGVQSPENDTAFDADTSGGGVFMAPKLERN